MSGVLEENNALSLALEFLEVFTAFANTRLPKFNLSYPIMDEEGNYLEEYEGQEYYTTYTWKDTGEGLIKKEIPTFYDEEVFITNHNMYNLFYKAQIYHMSIFSSPKCCGNYSILENYDASTYLMCLIEKVSGEKKCVMTFGFDIENMKFLELFDIYWVNGISYMKECDEIEKVLIGKQLMSIEEIEYLRSLKD